MQLHNSNEPFISILTTFYNAEPFVADYLDMLFMQTYSNWCCILVDDSPFQSSPQPFIDLQLTDKRFHLVKNTSTKLRLSPYSARNFGLQLVKTPLVAFCDIDDLWHPNKLEDQISFHIQNELDVSFTMHSQFSCHSAGCLVYQPSNPPSKTSLSALELRNFIPFSSCILTTFIAKSILFQPLPHEDYLYWLNIFTNFPGLRIAPLEKVYLYYRLHAANLSRAKVKMPLWIYSVFYAYTKSRVRSLLYTVRWSILKISLSVRQSFNSPVLNLSRFPWD